MISRATTNFQPTPSYLEQFLALRCAPDYLAARVLPGGKTKVKEISEAMAAVTAVRTALGPARFGDPEVVLADVGCGVAPRTAALFALMSRWQCLAVDPLLRRRSRVPRVRAHEGCIEDYGTIKASRLAVVVCVHSHAPMDFVGQIDAPDVLVVSIPCCTDARLPAAPVAAYTDYGILSPARKVYVWRGAPADLLWASARKE